MSQEAYEESFVENLIDEKAAALVLGLYVKTLQSWRMRGGGPSFVKLGRAIRYRPQDLLRFSEQRTFQSTSEVATRMMTKCFKKGGI